MHFITIRSILMHAYTYYPVAGIMNKDVKDIQTIDPVWKQMTEKLCGDFQKSGGEMIVVASQPQRQMYACCTSNAREQMLKNFKTFKECLQIPPRSSKPSLVLKKAAKRNCSLCSVVCEEQDMRDCKPEDAKYVLGIDVPQNSRICGDCSDSVQKYQDFKKMVIRKQNSSKVNLGEKAVSTTPERVTPGNKNVIQKPMSEVVKECENDSESQYSDEYCSIDSDMTGEMEHHDELKEAEKCDKKKQTTNSAKSEIKQSRPVTRSSLRETKKQNESKQIVAKKRKEVSLASEVTRPTRKKTPLILSKKNEAETKMSSGNENQNLTQRVSKNCTPAKTNVEPMNSNTSRKTRSSTGTLENSKQISISEKQKALSSSGLSTERQKSTPRLLAQKPIGSNSLTSLEAASIKEAGSVSEKLPVKKTQFSSASEKLKMACTASGSLKDTSTSSSVNLILVGGPDQFQLVQPLTEKGPLALDQMLVLSNFLQTQSEGIITPPAATQQTGRILTPSCESDLFSISSIVPSSLDKSKSSSTVLTTASTSVVSTTERQPAMNSAEQNAAENSCTSSGMVKILPPQTNSDYKLPTKQSCKPGERPLAPKINVSKDSEERIVGTSNNAKVTQAVPISTSLQTVVIVGAPNLMTPALNTNNAGLMLSSSQVPTKTISTSRLLSGNTVAMSTLSNSGIKPANLTPTSKNFGTKPANPMSALLNSGTKSANPNPASSNFETKPANPKPALLNSGTKPANLTPASSNSGTKSANPTPASSNFGTKPANPMPALLNSGTKPANPMPALLYSGTKPANPMPALLNSGTKAAMHRFLLRPEKKESKENTDIVNSSDKKESNKTILSTEAGTKSTLTVSTASTQKEIKSLEEKATLFKIGDVYYQLVVKDGKQFLVPNGQQLLIGQPDVPASQQKKIPELETEKNISYSNKRKLIEEEYHIVNPLAKAYQNKRPKTSHLKEEKKELTPELTPESESDPEVETIEEEEERLNKNTPEDQLPGKQGDPKSDESQTSAVDHEYTVRREVIGPVDCHKCDFFATYWRTMADHMRKHNMKRYCIKCNSFMTTRKFSSHYCKRKALRKARRQTCLVCSKLASNAVILFKHYRISHKSEIEKRGHCNALYRSVRSQNVFVCKGCLNVEYSELNMLSHVKKVHICVPSERTNSISHLLHKNEPVCACPVCWIHFPERKHLDYHLNVFHVSNDNHNCHLCNEKFNSKEDLVNHYSTHQPNIKYSCGICKEFIEPMSCLQEVINHRNALHPTNSLHVLLLCPESGCNESFDEDTEFLQHMTHHEIGQKYKHTCSKCEFSASSENISARHVAKFHYEPDRRCNICTKRFKTPSELDTHLEKHDKDVASEICICEYCGKINSNSTLHSQHMKKHRERMKPNTLFCEVCGEGFRAEPYLAKHMFVYHPEVKHSIVPTHFPCIYCDHNSLTSVAFRQHMSSHRKIKPYLCSFCDKRFCDTNLLKKHLIKHKLGISKKFRCFACHVDREAHDMRTHLQGETHKNNCQLAGINLQNYNQDLLNAMPSKSEMLERPINSDERSYVDRCLKIHEDHCQKAARVIAERETYSVMMSDGQELQIDMQSSNAQCQECGLVFKTDADLEEHGEFVRRVDSKAHRNNFTCQVCGIYLFGKITVVEHAGTERHIELCQRKGIDPGDVLDKNKIPNKLRKAKRKQISRDGYRCKICDIYLKSKESKDSHIEKAFHVDKCQELGEDPAGDHFEDYSVEKKVKKKIKTWQQERVKKPKEMKTDKVITKRKKRRVMIDLLGVKVPKVVAFGCLVCGVDLSDRIQTIDHLNTSKHIINCVCRGIHSGPANLKIIMDDYQSVIGKSIAELLGIPSNTAFPLSETDKTLYQKQIQEAESAKTRKKRLSLKATKTLENTIDLLEKKLFSPSALKTVSPQKPSRSYTQGQSISRGDISTSSNSQNDFYQSNSVSSNVAIPVYQGTFVPPSPGNRKRLAVRYVPMQSVIDDGQMIAEDQILYDDVTEVPDISQNTALAAFGAEAANLDSFK